MTSTDEPPVAPSLPWRASSIATVGTIGAICRAFLYGLSYTESPGLERFLGVLDERRDIEGRKRGLITVSNHVSVLDDPMIWGVLPMRYLLNPNMSRWSLGSYDLCFQNKVTSTFFTLGQVLPTHRSAHSSHGGLFQPTITQAIRLLSAGPYHKKLSQAPPDSPASKPSISLLSPDIVDPFTSAALTYTTTGHDTFPAPSAYLSRRHSWIHIFPEGKIHQKEDLTMRYFKWGVARLILESEPCPDLVALWIDGPQWAMHEEREFPRFVPRPGKNISVAFGDKVDMDGVFGDLREKWKTLKGRNGGEGLFMGELNEELKFGREAVELREECTMRVRKEVLKVRRQMGWPDEDPKSSLVETWRLEGAKEEGRMEDGSIVKDM
ncbi:hypothetical protein EJ05DRAFT_507021 [Pseudovirgaria hyperparasitica]|uniref:Tafazzin family protein n=1 Tax=Pseudovirgaria hyperparasitica TaxID=470096 RepID=A0A6A6WMP6_9PEZI|nr:uncharacterized protein EJ05DRAFT_507021 [Pseudovirgaria hyperparasitica]KAF2763422.1 hypothetical protein EJ05DRAFT_507021 [Pseudovirgaria hyperparasitica]